LPLPPTPRTHRTLGHVTRVKRWLIAASLAAGLAAAASSVPAVPITFDGESRHVDSTTAARLLSLDPEQVSEQDVADVLARVPAPRIILLQGSFAPVTMEPFARFLIAMGYPEDRIRNPHDGGLSTSSFSDSARLAGKLAWFYEHDGVRPLLVGHSQGGMLVIRVLHELAGEFTDAISVWNPVTDVDEHRTGIVDPLTGAARPVVGLRLPYATAMATGKLPRLLFGQWTMLAKLRRIPDSVEEFTGFGIEWDLVAGRFPGGDPYAATGTAVVRNVKLPAEYTHIGLPQASHLATNAVTRAWIDAYVPGRFDTAPGIAGADTRNLVHAADIWHSVKKHWCLEARRLVIARQGQP
jgi:hypothetical protein